MNDYFRDQIVNGCTGIEFIFISTGLTGLVSPEE